MKKTELAELLNFRKFLGDKALSYLFFPLAISLTQLTIKNKSQIIQTDPVIAREYRNIFCCCQMGYLD